MKLAPPSCRLVLASTLLAAFAACAGRQPAAAPAAASAPANAAKPTVDEQKAALDKLLAQELPALPTQVVTGPGAAFTARLEATAAPEVIAGDGFVQINAPMGPAPLLCIVYPEMKDQGELIRILTEDGFKRVGSHQWVEVHGDQVAGWGYVAARAHYLVEKDGETKFGDFKIATSVRGNTTVVCILDAPGYNATFERALRGFLGSLDVVALRGVPRPTEDSLTRMALPGRSVDMTRTTTDTDGDSRTTVAFSTRLTLGSEGQLITADDAKREVFRKGVLEEGNYASVSGGQMEHELQLRRSEETYRVTGTVQDKPVTGDFVVAGGLWEQPRLDAELCQLKSGAKASAEQREYMPGTDPLHATAVVVKRSETQDADVVATIMDGVQMFARLDARCAVVKGTLKMGADLSFAYERIWHQGI